MTPFFGWLRGSRRRREQDAAHAAAWAQSEEPDGVKPVQRSAQARLDSVAGGLLLWSVEPSTQEMGTTLVGRASHVPLNVWLRPDTFSFKLGEKGDYVEWWDYETPTKMVEAFIARVESELRRYTKS